MKKISLYDYYEFKKTTQIPEKPFTPGLLRAVFTKGHRSVMVNGFYDGEGTFVSVSWPIQRGSGIIKLRVS
jgi:hypothetical protein